jgi:hypothetical protein
MLPPGLTVVTATFELEPDRNSAHYAIEVRDGVSGSLLAMHVRPLRTSTDWPTDLQDAVSFIHGVFGALNDPF